MKEKKKEEERAAKAAAAAAAATSQTKAADKSTPVDMDEIDPTVRNYMSSILWQ